MTEKKKKEEKEPEGKMPGQLAEPSEVDEGEVSKALVQSMSGLEPKDLKRQIDNTQQAFELMGQFIKANLKEGIDYGIIEYQQKNTGKMIKTKPFLHKPGSEKFTILFGHRPSFKWINQDFTTGIFAVKCYILNKKGGVVGEGFGSAKVGERPTWTENEAMKMACKRAQIDAALRTYGLSEHFTQDEEVMTRKPSVSTPTTYSRPSATSQAPRQFQMREDGSPITQNQMNMIFGSIERLGHDKAWFENWVFTQIGVQGVENLTKFQASKFIDTLLQQEAKQRGNAARTFPSKPATDMPIIEYEEESLEPMPEGVPKDVVEKMKKEVEEFDNNDQPFADL